MKHIRERPSHTPIFKTIFTILTKYIIPTISAIKMILSWSSKD